MNSQQHGVAWDTASPAKGDLRMPMDYKQYQEEVTADVAKIIADASCQPILFIGSGFTKRYAKGPNWEELLGLLAEACPLIDKDFAYYMRASDCEKGWQ